MPRVPKSKGLELIEQCKYETKQALEFLDSLYYEKDVKERDKALEAALGMLREAQLSIAMIMSESERQKVLEIIMHGEKPCKITPLR